MSDDSPDPQSSGSSSSSQDDAYRPHALDHDHDDWSGPSKTWFTVRNAMAASLTLFASSVLAIFIGLPNSVGAMIGVWVATAALFGPLWFALFNQNFGDRFGPTEKAEAEEQTGEHAVTDLMTSRTQNDGAAEASAGQPTSASRTLRGMLDAASGESSGPSRQPLTSYYQPIQQRDLDRSISLSRVGYAVVVIFAVFVGLLVLGSPFLAAVIVYAFG